MNGYEYALESDELFESDESDESFESDEYDELSERRRRQSGRPPRISPGRTGRGTGLFRPRPANGNKYATQAQLEAGLARVGRQISDNSNAIRKVATQANRINSELGAAKARLEKQVSEIRKEVKKQAETSMLLTLLQKAPELEAKPGADSVEAKKVTDNVQVKKQDNLLLFALMGGGIGDNLPLLLLASDKL